jgi:outer membrane protein assembly factor BamB
LKSCKVPWAQTRLLLVVAVTALTLQSCFQAPSPAKNTSGTQAPSTQAPSTLPLAELWCIQDSDLVSYPLYANGLVFTVDAKTPTVTHKAFAASTGILTWTAKSPNENGTAGNRKYWLVDDKYYVSGDAQSVTVFDALTGKVLWQADHMGMEVGFAAGDGKLFVGTQPNTLAYDLATGKSLWGCVPGQERAAAAPLYDPLNRVVVLDQAEYWLLNPQDGNFIFRAPGRLGNGLEATDKGFIHDGLLFYDDEVVEVKTNKVIHPGSIGSSLFDLPVIVNNHLLIAVFEEVVALDLKTFTEAWRYHTSSVDGHPLEIEAGPVAVGDNAYILLSNATLLALDLNNGKEIGAWQGHQLIDVRDSGPARGFSTPLRPGLAVGDGMLFAAFGTKELCSFGPKTNSATP